MSTTRGRNSIGSRVTARDVALAAGVSLTTVSHALNGKGRVHAETRDRVRRLAEEMGYTPDQRALALKMGETGLLAYVSSIAPEFGEGLGFQYVAEFAAAAAQVALSSGRVLALVPSAGNIDWMRTLAMDGAIVNDPSLDDPLLAALRRRYVPYVSIGPEPGRSFEEQWWVSSDEQAATILALDHLYGRGSRNIVLVETAEVRWYAQLSRSTYERWAAEHKMPARVCLIDEASATKGAKRAIEDLIAIDKSVDGAYSPENVFGVGVLEGALASGRSVPEEFRIVTMDSVWGLSVRPQLTGVDPRIADTAGEAVRMLVARLTEPEGQAVSKLLDPRLVVRGSS